MNKRKLVLFSLLWGVLMFPLFGFQVDDSTGWTIAIQVATIIVALGAGGPGIVWLVNRLKEALGLSGGSALALTIIVSIVFAVAGVIVDGTFTPGEFQWDRLSFLFLLLYQQAHTIYRMLKDREST